jgi:hypothetical protein
MAGALEGLKPQTARSFLSLSVEEENLASVPFAMLERNVRGANGKIEIRGTKVLPDGTSARVLWQVQGNNELGLPTEQDLDIFVALGVLTFRNNFDKTVTFSGREMARMLKIAGVHGRFYQRLKVAMDRLIALRFRAILETDRQEEVKWLSVFQEASYSLDRKTGRCLGSITWTDKLIQSMNSGLFRLLDASRYMELDGLTAKHLYRFLALAFERSDVVIVDSRDLSLEHLGMRKLPRYFSRLMQTLEPAIEQLIRVGIVGSYSIVDSAEWRIALRRHESYVPERVGLLQSGGAADNGPAYCQAMLERAGLTAEAAAEYTERFSSRPELYQLQRAARLVEQMKNEGVTPHVALGFLRQALQSGPSTAEAIDALDWCEIAVEICHRKRAAGEALRNLPGLLVKIARDPATRARLAPEEEARRAKARYRQQEDAAGRLAREREERELLAEYELYRQQAAAQLFREMNEFERQALRKEKVEMLRQQNRLQLIPETLRDQEADRMILQDLGQKEIPAFEKWRLRQRVRQVALPFGDPPATDALAAAPSHE